MDDSDATLAQEPKSEIAQEPELVSAPTPEPAPAPEPEPEITHEPELVSAPAPASESEITHEPETAPPPYQEPKIIHEPETAPPPYQEPEITHVPELVFAPTVPKNKRPAQEPAPLVVLNLPIQDLLLDERRREFFDICVPLYEASIKGDLEAAEAILNNNRGLVRYSITEQCDTALHVAASAQSNTQSIHFVEYLVSMMEMGDLELQNRSGNTAFCLAAAAGNVEIAKIMVGRNQDLLSIPNSKEMTPLYIAALYRNHDMVNYLYDLSPQMDGPGWTPIHKGWLYTKCVEVDLFDMALRILKDHPDIPRRESALEVLAQKSSAFNEIEPHTIWRMILINSFIWNMVRPAAEESKAMELLRAIWTSIEEKPKIEMDRILRGRQLMKDGDRTNPSQVLFVATEMGNTNFVVELIHKYPDLIWMCNDNNQSIFHTAVSHRRESIYSLLYEIGSTKAFITSLLDNEDNNMLHLAGKRAEKNQPQDVPGVAFQLQRELLWFKEVESMVPPHCKDEKNKDDQTPQELFTETHKALVSEAEKWMKGTASKCMVVAALIATVVFGVAFTIPGQYDQKSGFPIFLHNGPFIAFVIFDALSMILSSTSILAFLSILTSRYAQEDFIEALPKKLMLGLGTLFLSIVTMMIAFSVSFFVLYRHKFISVAVIISILALIPIVSYANLQFPLLMGVIHSTIGSRYLFRPKKRILYQNPRF